MSDIKPEIVVASYRENLWWVPKLQDMGYSVTVYNTAENYEPLAWELDSNSEVTNLLKIPHIKLPNTDREAGQYLHHLVSNRDNLPEYTVFLQADIGWSVCNIDKRMMGASEDSFTSLVEWLDKSKNCQADYLTFGLLSPQYLTMHSQGQVLSDNCQKAYREFMEPFGATSYPPMMPVTTNGAQFRVSRKKILSLPKAYLENLLEVSTKNPLSHRFEYMWGLILDGSKMSFTQLEETNKTTNETRNQKNENIIPETTRVC